MKKEEAYWPLILLLALIKFVLPLFLQDGVYELQRDEYLYYQQGQHLALGYLENPPLLSYLAKISSLFGGGEAWIKIWPCLFGAATVVITCLIAAEFGGKIFAQFIAGLSVITGAYLRIHYLFQPNILDIFFWALAVYFIIRYINDQTKKNIFWFVISLALGFWGKYTIVFIATSLFIALLFSRHRKIFTEKTLYTSGLIALIIILPNVWWQYKHNWPLIHHMQELQETQLRFLNPLDFIKDQFLMLFPVLIIWTGGFIWLIKQKQWRFLAFTFLLVLTLLIIGRGKSYYSLGAYPILLAAGAVAWERWTKKRNWSRYLITFTILLFSLLFIPLLLPVWKPEKLAGFYQKNGIAKSGLLKWEDGKDHELPQDFADMLGWKELTQKTESFYHSLPDSSKSSTIIFGRHYGHAGSMQFYGKGKLFKSLVNTDNGSFLLWIPEDLWFKNLILISRRMPDKDDEVFQHFEKASVIDSVTNAYSRQFGDKIIFFENIDSTGLKLAKDGLKEMKNQFNH